MYAHEAKSKSQLEQMIAERSAAHKLRQAVQYCKEVSGFAGYQSDRHLDAEGRFKMERCLTQNFLLKFGMDVFGKRDLLYIDMKGDQDVAGLTNKELIHVVKPEKPAEEAAEGGDDAADEAGDDDE